MAAVAAEAAATAASPGDGGEAEPELGPTPGREAGADPTPVTMTDVELLLPEPNFTPVLEVEPLPQSTATAADRGPDDDSNSPDIETDTPVKNAETCISLEALVPDSRDERTSVAAEEMEVEEKVEVEAMVIDSPATDARSPLPLGAEEATEEPTDITVVEAMVTEQETVVTKQEAVAVPRQETEMFAEQETVLITEQETELFAEQDTMLITEQEAAVVTEQEAPVAASAATDGAAGQEVPAAAPAEPEAVAAAGREAPAAAPADPEAVAVSEPQPPAVATTDPEAVAILPADPETVEVPEPQAPAAAPVDPEAVAIPPAGPEAVEVPEPQAPATAPVDPEAVEVPQPQAPVAAPVDPEAVEVPEPQAQAAAPDDPEAVEVPESQTPAAAPADPEAVAVPEPETVTAAPADPEAMAVPEPETVAVSEQEVMVAASAEQETVIKAQEIVLTDQDMEITATEATVTELDQSLQTFASELKSDVQPESVVIPDCLAAADLFSMTEEATEKVFAVEKPSSSSLYSFREAVTDVPAQKEQPSKDDPPKPEELPCIPLMPGTQVVVTLDHIIQDAVVVSFQLGERLFSGVLMDVSRRFGPYGIPVTVFPKRDYKDKPETTQLPTETFQQELPPEKWESKDASREDASQNQSSEPCRVKSCWTSQTPPLFHEGAPYPPPLFIRDTYSLSLPQPPPRKIKRPKRKLYREEPPSIMNAIRLRPRQVLCDKCKNTMVADKKEIRRGGSTTDSSRYDDSRKRRCENVPTVNKRFKTDQKGDAKGQNESQKRTVVKVSNIAHNKGKVIQKVASQANSSKEQLSTKKVLQSKNVDHTKVREMVRMARKNAQKKRQETSVSKNAIPKGHLTRRLQNSNSGSLPPRLRLKPQRYRNEENDSSYRSGLDRLRSSKTPVSPTSRCISSRSAGEDSPETPNSPKGPKEASSAGEAPTELQNPPNGPEEATIEHNDNCVPDDQEEQLPVDKSDKGDITLYMTIKQSKSESSNASVCSSDSTDDLKSSNSECSSTETFDFPPGSMHAPSTSSSSSSSKEEKKLTSSLKMRVFSKNVSKCITPDGRTICVGDIVWAKIYGFPWWPARILAITVSRKDNGLLVRQEARISWFGSPTTSFLALTQMSPFLDNFHLRFNKKRRGLYRKAITEAAKAAKQLTPEVRALLTQFET